VHGNPDGSAHQPGIAPNRTLKVALAHVNDAGTRINATAGGERTPKASSAEIRAPAVVTADSVQPSVE